MHILCLVSANRVKRNHSNVSTINPRDLVYPHINREPLVEFRSWNSRSIRNKITAPNAYGTQN